MMANAITSPAPASTGISDQMASGAGGTVPKRVLVRTAGPGLGAFGIPGFMPQPALAAYDADPASNAAPRLINVSTGGYVGSDTETLIGGFVIAGATRGNNLIRGIGPSLRTFGVTDVVTDCAISVYTIFGLAAPPLPKSRLLR